MVVVTVGAVLSAVTYRQQAAIAEKAREDARREADTAKQISEVLTGLFEECVGVTIRNARASEPEPLTTGTLRKLPLGRLIQDARRSYLAMLRDLTRSWL